jgi:hypothetical protein
MKSIKNKIILFATLPITIMTLSSCVKTKDYDCECTYVARSGGSSAGQPDKWHKTQPAGNIMPYRKKPVVYDNTGRAFCYTVFSDSGTFV